MRRDGVTPEMRSYILERDRGCILARLIPDHQCKDAWGNPMPPEYAPGLSLEHVKSDLAMAMRAPSDPEHLVVICGGSNVGVPSKYERGLLRAYLAEVNGVAVQS